MAGRYRDAVPKVKGGVQAILLRPEVVEGWSWILMRASYDVTEYGDDETQRVITDLGPDSAIVGLIERAGARLALPEAYNPADWHPLPTVEFWKSHVTGEQLPNPWTTDDKNEQAWVRQNLGDAFADELEIAARGGRSYHEEFERRAEAELAAVVKDFPPDGFNPHVEAFDGGDTSPQAIEWHQHRAEEIRRLAKENPPLNAWLKKTAQPLYPNPFEANPAYNLTLQMMVRKSDGAFARHLERTAAWKSAQLNAELLEAERVANEARKAAEQAKFAARQRLHGGR
ncbi:MAG TPA: hypothetical protein VFZ59_04510 [Verrucomicrobiae bacterium]|nr:hypothetical protein [Verrucomicrobiae bacterium]